jgi:hypothetical protein
MSATAHQPAAILPADEVRPLGTARFETIKAQPTSQYQFMFARFPNLCTLTATRQSFTASQWHQRLSRWC